MNEREWLRQLGARPWEEISDHELRDVRRRMSESPEFCEALLSDPQLSRLVDAVMRLPEEPPAPTAATAPTPRRRSYAFPIVAGLLVVCLACAIFWGLTRSGRFHVVERTDAPPVADGPPVSPESEAAPLGSAAPDAPAEAPAEAKPSLADAPATAPADAPPKVALAPEEAPVKPAAPPPPPWQDVLDNPDPPPPYSAICWEGFDTRFSLPTRESLQAWFEPVPGHGLRWTDTRLPNGVCGTFEGVMRLRAPLGDDRVLRLALDNFPRLQLHLFSARGGVTLAWSQDDPRWAAYATQRDADAMLPRSWRLIATDAGRARRTEFRAGGPWELRHRDGQVVVSRGDVVLLQAPLADVPTEVLFQGRATFYGLALARTSDAPPCESSWPEHAPTLAAAAAFEAPPAAEWRSKLPEGVTWERDASGAWKLESPGVPSRGWVATRLPQVGMHEIVMQFSEAGVGAGVFLAPPDQPPQQVLRFTLDKRTGSKSLVWCGDDDRVEVPVPAAADAVAPFAQDTPWLRLVVGCGLVRAWQSGNGVEWVELPAAARLATRGLTHFGLHHVGGGKSVSIALRRLWIQPLEELGRTVDLSLVSDPQALLAAKDLAGWEQVVRDTRPPATEELAWWRACAAHTLAAGPEPAWGQAVLDRWLDSLDPTWPLEQRFRVFGESAALMDVTDSAAVAQQFVARYHRLAWEAFESHGTPPLSSVRRTLQQTAFHQRQNDVAFEPRAVRTELLQTLYAARWHDTLDLVRQLRFYHQQAQTPLLDWADMVARRATPGRDAPDTATNVPLSRSMPGGGASRTPARDRERFQRRDPRSRRDALRGKDGWLHPLNEELAKETYNALAELDSLLDAGAFDDAARLITQLNPGQVQGLAPLDSDDELLASLPTAVGWFAAQFPALRDAVRARFDNLAPLRMRPAMQSGEASAVELVALQFAGTAAASEGQQWLGDRALAAGSFPMARAAYRRARDSLPAAQLPALDARLRLVGALMGDDLGAAPSQPITLGQRTISVAEFEAIVAESRARAQGGRRIVAERRLDAVAPPAPRPATALEPQARALLDGPIGERPQEEVTRNLDRLQVDWAGRQLGWLIDGDMLLVNNRFQIAAFNLQTGQRAWQTTPPEGKKVPRSRDWSLVSMTPRVFGNRVYARLLYGDGPLLGCWDATNGQLVWLADQLPGVHVASDPWFVQDRLIALTVTRTEGPEVLLRLATFDAFTGDLLAHADLVQLRASWYARHCCETNLADDTLIAVLGGAILACDSRGQVRWVRREVVLPAEEESEWVTQGVEPPLVRGDRVYVGQPGVRVVDCLEVDTGRRVWRRFLPDVRRVASLLDDRLIIVTDRGVEALAADDGRSLWRFEARNLLQGFVSGGPHGIVLSQTTPADDGKRLRPQLVWLDAANGQVRTTATLEPFADPAPRLGPLIPHGQRLFTFFGRGQAEAKRELLECVYK